MTHLTVTLRYLGGVIEHRTVVLRDGLRFGEATGSVVSFPTSTVALRRDHLGWTIAGHRLVSGRPMVLAFGDFEVAFEGLEEVPARRTEDQGPDARLLVATLAIVLSAAWLDTVDRVWHRNPEIAQEIRARLFTHDVGVAGVTEDGVDDTGRVDPEWPPAERHVELD